MTTKQIQIEEILNRALSKKEMNHIETNWNAFYEEPEYYKGSVVIDMVRLSIATM